MSAWLNSEGIGPALRMDDGGEWRGALVMSGESWRWRFPCGVWQWH